MPSSVFAPVISSAAAGALREGSEGNVPKCGPRDAASFLGGPPLRDRATKSPWAQSVSPVSAAVCPHSLSGFVSGHEIPTGQNKTDKQKRCICEQRWNRSGCFQNTRERRDKPAWSSLFGGCTVLAKSVTEQQFLESQPKESFYVKMARKGVVAPDFQVKLIQEVVCWKTKVALANRLLVLFISSAVKCRVTDCGYFLNGLTCRSCCAMLKNKNTPITALCRLYHTILD